MTIAFVSIIREPWGGSEELWYASAAEALSSGHRVIISAFDCGFISSKTKNLIDKGAIPDLRIGSITKNISLPAYFKKRIKRAYQKKIGNPFSNLFKYKPDVVLYIGTAYSIYEDKKLLALIIKNKTVFFINSQLNYELNYAISSREKRVVSKAYRLAKKIFFVSEKNRLVAEKHLGHSIPNGMVIRNPVNISSTEIIPFPLTDKMYFAMVGRLQIVHKGQDIVLQILSTDKWKNRNWHLNIFGNGEDEDHLKQIAESNGLNDKIHFHGNVNDIRNIWEDNHILLMPSHMEGMPLAIVEAMLCGRTCVATDVGGITEWIEEDKSGFISENDTLLSFAKTLEKAWNNKGKWESMGISAHHRAMDLYDLHAGKTLLELMIKNGE